MADQQGTLSMSHARDVAIAAARAAGSLIVSRASKQVTIHDKGADGDVVSDLDLAAEKVIVEHILASFPTHQIDTEESGVVGADSDAVWIIDPLDGTSNVAIGLPVLSIGIVLCIDKIPVVGVIHEPLVDRTCSAIRGRGATFDDAGLLATISRQGPRDASHPLVAWTQGRSVGSGEPAAVAYKLTIERESYRLIQTWAPLVMWAMLARGDIDGFVGYRAGTDDLHAGVLIVCEAGMQIRDLSGGAFDERYHRDRERSFVAASVEMLPRLLAMTAASESVRDRLPAEVLAAPAEPRAAQAEPRAASAQTRAVPAEPRAAPAEPRAASAQTRAAPVEVRAAPAVVRPTLR